MLPSGSVEDDLELRYVITRLSISQGCVCAPAIKVLKGGSEMNVRGL